MTKGASVVEVQISYLGVLVAGVVSTAILVVLGRLISLGLLDLPRYLGTLYRTRENWGVGFSLLCLVGCLFTLVYAALWSAGIGRPFYLGGPLFGLAQWLLVGFLLGMLPFAHRGIKAGTVPVPGYYMSRIMGGWGFPAGLLSHMVFGFSVAYMYQFFIYR